MPRATPPGPPTTPEQQPTPTPPAPSAPAVAGVETLFDALPVAATLVHPSGRLERANTAYLRLTGWQTDEIIGHDPQLLIHPADRWRHGDITESLLGGAVVVERSPRCLRKDGSEFRGRLVCSLVGDPADPRVLTVIEDITELHLTRAELERSETRYRKIIEHVTDVVTLVDRTGRILWTTAGVRNSLGHPPASWRGTFGLDLIHPEDRGAVNDLLTDLIHRPGTLAQVEARLRRADGTWDLTVFTAMNLLDDPDVGAIAVASRSIAEERKVAEELARRRDEALESSRAKSEYVANVTHEIRTPLHAILGLSELLCSGGLGAEETRLAESVQREARNLREVIDGILDFSRIEAGRMELVREPFSPAAVADRVGELLRAGAEAKRLTFTVEVDPNVPRAALGDEARVRQVLVNLCGNAVKYTDHGRVNLGVAMDESTGDLLLEVSDTGRGIPAGDLARIFEPFTQTRADDARRGSGLGLAICRRLIELMGGSLNVHSELGVGSTFTVRIPVQQTATGPMRTPTAIAGGRITGAEVLVVEDNEVNRTLARSQLERLGHHCTLAHTGEAALDLLSVERFDLVLMDWFMPGMDGLETTRRWRRMEPEGRHVPIVAMTASATASDREQCIAAGMDDFLPKPVSIHDLASMLEHWLADTHRPKVQHEGPGVEGPVIETLIDELGDRSLVANVISTYLRELPSRRKLIAEALREQRSDDLRRAAHTLKSTSATLGAARLARLCADLEHNPQPPADRIEELVSELEESAGTAQVELARWVVTLSQTEDGR